MTGENRLSDADIVTETASCRQQAAPAEWRKPADQKLPETAMKDGSPVLTSENGLNSPIGDANRMAEHHPASPAARRSSFRIATVIEAAPTTEPTESRIRPPPSRCRRDRDDAQFRCGCLEQRRSVEKTKPAPCVVTAKTETRIVRRQGAQILGGARSD